MARVQNRKPGYRGEEKRRYDKKSDLREVEQWRREYPWYDRLVRDINETLAYRDRSCSDYHRLSNKLPH